MSRDRDEHRGGTDRALPPRLDPRGGRPARPHGSTAAVVAPRRAPGGARAVVAARVVAGVLSALLLAGSGWGWYLGRVADASVNRTAAIPGSGNADADGVPEAMNLLLVGNDYRANLTPEQLAEFSTTAFSGTNTDTMILVHVPADGSRASFVSFPRDSYVEIPGHGGDKLNAAYTTGYDDVEDSAPEEEKKAGGQQLLIRTISELSGLGIDHYAEVDLLGFFELTDIVGGVEVNLCSAVQDQDSGADFEAGKQTIEGAEALAFVRQRKGVRPDGSPAMPRGDLDRIVRQQVFIGGMLRTIISQEVLLDLGKQRQLVREASESLTVDEDLDLFDLATQLQSVTPADIQFETVPIADPAGVDDEGRSIVELADDATLREFFRTLSEEPEGADAPAAPATVAPSEVSVDVYNGVGIPGLAAETEVQLEAAGFVVTSTGDADRSDYERTTVRHAAGDEALAATLAAQIPGAVTEVVDDATSGTVQLVLGADFEGVGQETAPTEPAPESSEAPARTAADESCIN